MQKKSPDRISVTKNMAAGKQIINKLPWMEDLIRMSC